MGLVDKYEAENDDYSKIMAQALADRLVEAFAEVVHKDIRTNTWGYAPDEQMDAADLLKIKYDGIRPAPGYPSQPDHSEKTTMWNLIQAKEKAGIELSETLSMLPASSVSALVFAHPASQYFAVGQVCKDQVESYSKRKGASLEQTEKWLSPLLNSTVNKLAASSVSYATCTSQGLSRTNDHDPNPCHVPHLVKTL